MPNFPGSSNTLPSVVTDVVTQSRGLSLPSGIRIAAIVGEGSTDETIVSTAVGGGKDGLNSSYSSSSGADGRHFQMQNFPLISNRTTLYKNGAPLVGLESTIDTNAFSYKYDYRIDISTGQIELQKGHIQEQGGDGYVPLSTNVGVGYLDTLTLVDDNAPPETWTIRCVSVQRDNLNDPIANTAKFLGFGSVSGAKLDANGNPVVWKADGYVVSNGILSFAIEEGVTPFREGDGFTVKVASGVLVRNDSLTVNCIPSTNLNDAVLLQGLGPVVDRHGSPSTDNALSLGAQLAFSNAAPAVVAVQAAPAMPRRTSYELVDSFKASSTNNDDFVFPLPMGVVPNLDSNIHFFVTDNVTNVETQILPNKLDFYTIDTVGYPNLSTFTQDDTVAPTGYSYFYSVIKTTASVDSGMDGYIARVAGFTNKGIFSSSTEYDSSYVGKSLKIIDGTNVANNGTYTISSVTNGKLYATLDGDFADFTNENPTSFQVIDPATGNSVLGSATDGVLTLIVSTATATLDSDTVTGLDFSTITSILTKRLKINGSSDNNGIYDIIDYDNLNNTITIEKAVVNETALRYEILDSGDESYYVVVNHNVVPDGNALRVSIIDQKDASFYDAGWLNALEALELVECDIVVPLPKQTVSVIFQNTLNHCKTMSNIKNKKERVLFCGTISGLTPDNLIGTEDAAVEDIGILEGIQGDSVTEVLAGNVEDLANYSVADAFGTTYRCVYFYPDEITVNASGENVVVDGFYLAAAAAGYLSADPRLENPLTNKVLSGFTIDRSKTLSTLTMEQLAAAGVTIVQPVAGGGRVIWGKTTTQSGFPEEQEISIIFIRDRVAKTMRAGLAGFIGTAETPDTQTILATRAVLILNSLVSQSLISDYRDLNVQRDSVDPTQWNISVRVQPVYPLNFIYVKVGVGQL